MSGKTTAEKLAFEACENGASVFPEGDNRYKVQFAAEAVPAEFIDLCAATDGVEWVSMHGPFRNACIVEVEA